MAFLTEGLELFERIGCRSAPSSGSDGSSTTTVTDSDGKKTTTKTDKNGKRVP